MHPFLLAQLWRQKMERDAKLTKDRIAAREGFFVGHEDDFCDLLLPPCQFLTHKNHPQPSAAAIPGSG
jgi:hypothetical protein